MSHCWQTPWDVFGADLARWTCTPHSTVDGLRELDVSFGPRSTSPIIISLATAAYLPAARALREDCVRLGLDHDIAYVSIHDPPASVRQCATRLKRGYIEAMLQLHHRPVWWLDVDGQIKARPPEIPRGTWLVVHPQQKPAYPIKSSVIYLRPSASAWQLLDLWQSLHQAGTEDHTPLIAAWRQIQRHSGILSRDSSDWLKVDGRHPTGSAGARK